MQPTAAARLKSFFFLRKNSFFWVSGFSFVTFALLGFISLGHAFSFFLLTELGEAAVRLDRRPVASKTVLLGDGYLLPAFRNFPVVLTKEQFWFVNFRGTSRVGFSEFSSQWSMTVHCDC